MTRNYPNELRWRVVFMLREGRTTSEIAHTLHVGKTFVKKIKRLFETNSCVDDRPRSGKLRSLSAQEILLLKNIIEQYPEVYEDEMQEWLEYLTGKTFSIAAIHRCIQKLGWTRRKLSLVAYQRNERLRAEFRRRIAQFEPHQLLFIDESSKDERTFQRRYARGLKGRRISVKGNFTRGTRYSVTGAFNQTQFEFAVSNFILPFIGSCARRESCSVVILDNCTIHNSNELFQAVRRRGGIVMFLPPYSPDMNPIEEAFGSSKTWLQRHPDVCKKYPKWCFEISLSKITDEQSAGYFMDSGYF